MSLGNIFKNTREKKALNENFSGIKCNLWLMVLEEEFVTRVAKIVGGFAVSTHFFPRRAPMMI